jgi:hypothetical protein
VSQFPGHLILVKGLKYSLHFLLIKNLKGVPCGVVFLEKQANELGCQKKKKKL